MVRLTFMAMTTWLLIPAIVLCFLALWIVVPPFHAGLLPLAVGAPELSPWLLVGSLGVCALTFQAASVVQGARPAFTVAAIAAILSAYPLLRTPLALREFDRSMEEGLGGGYFDQIPPATRAGPNSAGSTADGRGTHRLPRRRRRCWVGRSG